MNQLVIKEIKPGMNSGSSSSSTREFLSHITPTKENVSEQEEGIVRQTDQEFRELIEQQIMDELAQEFATTEGGEPVIFERSEIIRKRCSELVSEAWKEEQRKMPQQLESRLVTVKSEEDVRNYEDTVLSSGESLESPSSHSRERVDENLKKKIKGILAKKEELERRYQAVIKNQKSPDTSSQGQSSLVQFQEQISEQIPFINADINGSSQNHSYEIPYSLNSRNLQASQGFVMMHGKLAQQQFDPKTERAKNPVLIQNSMSIPTNPKSILSPLNRKDIRSGMLSIKSINQLNPSSASKILSAFSPPQSNQQAALYGLSDIGASLKEAIFTNEAMIMSQSAERVHNANFFDIVPYQRVTEAFLSQFTEAQIEASLSALIANIFGVALLDLGRLYSPSVICNELAKLGLLARYDNAHYFNSMTAQPLDQALASIIEKSKTVSASASLKSLRSKTRPVSAQLHSTIELPNQKIKPMPQIDTQPAQEEPEERKAPEQEEIDKLLADVRVGHQRVKSVKMLATQLHQKVDEHMPSRQLGFTRQSRSFTPPDEEQENQLQMPVQRTGAAPEVRAAVPLPAPALMSEELASSSARSSTHTTIQKSYYETIGSEYGEEDDESASGTQEGDEEGESDGEESQPARAKEGRWVEFGPPPNEDGSADSERSSTVNVLPRRVWIPEDLCLDPKDPADLLSFDDPEAREHLERAANEVCYEALHERAEVRCNSVWLAFELEGWHNVVDRRLEVLAEAQPRWTAAIAVREVTESKLTTANRSRLEERKEPEDNKYVVPDLSLPGEEVLSSAEHLFSAKSGYEAPNFFKQLAADRPLADALNQIDQLQQAGSIHSSHESEATSESQDTEARDEVNPGIILSPKATAVVRNGQDSVSQSKISWAVDQNYLTESQDGRADFGKLQGRFKVVAAAGGAIRIRDMEVSPGAVAFEDSLGQALSGGGLPHAETAGSGSNAADNLVFPGAPAVSEFKSYSAKPPVAKGQRATGFMRQPELSGSQEVYQSVDSGTSSRSGTGLHAASGQLPRNAHNTAAGAGRGSLAKGEQDSPFGRGAEGQIPFNKDEKRCRTTGPYIDAMMVTQIHIESGIRDEPLVAQDTEGSVLAVHPLLVTELRPPTRSSLDVTDRAPNPSRVMIVSHGTSRPGSQFDHSVATCLITEALGVSKPPVLLGRSGEDLEQQQTPQSVASHGTTSRLTEVAPSKRPRRHWISDSRGQYIQHLDPAIEAKHQLIASTFSVAHASNPPLTGQVQAQGSLENGSQSDVEPDEITRQQSQLDRNIYEASRQLSAVHKDVINTSFAQIENGTNRERSCERGRQTTCDRFRTDGNGEDPEALGLELALKVNQSQKVVLQSHQSAENFEINYLSSKRSTFRGGGDLEEAQAEARLHTLLPNQTGSDQPVGEDAEPGDYNDFLQRLSSTTKAEQEDLLARSLEQILVVAPFASPAQPRGVHLLKTVQTLVPVAQFTILDTESARKVHPAPRGLVIPSQEDYNLSQETVPDLRSALQPTQEIMVQDPNEPVFSPGIQLETKVHFGTPSKEPFLPFKKPKRTRSRAKAKVQDGQSSSKSPTSRRKGTRKVVQPSPQKNRIVSFQRPEFSKISALTASQRLMPVAQRHILQLDRLNYNWNQKVREMRERSYLYQASTFIAESGVPINARNGQRQPYLTTEDFTLNETLQAKVPSGSSTLRMARGTSPRAQTVTPSSKAIGFGLHGGLKLYAPSEEPSHSNSGHAPSLKIQPTFHRPFGAFGGQNSAIVAATIQSPVQLARGSFSTADCHLAPQNGSKALVSTTYILGEQGHTNQSAQDYDRGSGSEMRNIFYQDERHLKVGMINQTAVADNLRLLQHRSKSSGPTRKAVRPLPDNQLNARQQSVLRKNQWKRIVNTLSKNPDQMMGLVPDPPVYSKKAQSERLDQLNSALQRRKVVRKRVGGFFTLDAPSREEVRQDFSWADQPEDLVDRHSRHSSNTKALTMNMGYTNLGIRPTFISPPPAYTRLTPSNRSSKPVFSGGALLKPSKLDLFSQTLSGDLSLEIQNFARMKASIRASPARSAKRAVKKRQLQT